MTADAAGDEGRRNTRLAPERVGSPSMMKDGGRRLGWLCALLIVVVAIWNTRESLDYDFVARDDDINIYFNSHLGPPGAQSVRWMFTDVAYMRRYVPLGWLTFSSVYAFSGLSPRGYHAANVALHAVNSLLVFGVLLLVARHFNANRASSRAQVAAAAVGAAMWSCHPFRAETVGWASGLLYGAAGFWALTSVLAYVLSQAADPARGRRLGWLAVAWAGYAFSILTYPMGIALPLVFVAMDLAGRKNRTTPPSWRRLAIEKMGFVVPGAAVLAFTVLARFEASSFWPPPPTWEQFPLVQRVAQSMAVWSYYLWKTLWPVNLTPAPTWLFEIDPLGARFVLSTVLVVGISASVWFVRAWRGAWWLWLAYLAILVPLLGLTEHPHFPGDRYGYLAGVILSAAWVLAIVRVRGTWRVGLSAAAFLMIVGGGWSQRGQLRVWRDTDALLTHDLLARRFAGAGEIDFMADNFRKWAMFHANRGEFTCAQEILAQAERSAAGHPRVLALRQELETASARAAGERAARSAGPEAAKLHAKLAMEFARAGRVREARDHFCAARQLAPQSATLAFNWAVFCALNGEPLRALQLYYRSINGASPDDVALAARAQLMSLVADSLATVGNPRLALHAIDTAIALAGSSGPEAEERAAALQAQRERLRTAAGAAR